MLNLEPTTPSKTTSTRQSARVFETSASSKATEIPRSRWNLSNLMFFPKLFKIQSSRILSLCLVGLGLGTPTLWIFSSRWSIRSVWNSAALVNSTHPKINKSRSLAKKELSTTKASLLIPSLPTALPPKFSNSSLQTTQSNAFGPKTSPWSNISRNFSLIITKGQNLSSKPITKVSREVSPTLKICLPPANLNPTQVLRSKVIFSSSYHNFWVT